jgi:hypothetical protein
MNRLKKLLRKSRWSWLRKRRSRRRLVRVRKINGWILRIKNIDAAILSYKLFIFTFNSVQKVGDVSFISNVFRPIKP